MACYCNPEKAMMDGRIRPDYVMGDMVAPAPVQESGNDCMAPEIPEQIIGDDDICTVCGALIANTRRDDHVKFHEEIAELIGWARSAGEFLAKLFRTY